MKRKVRTVFATIFLSDRPMNRVRPSKLHLLYLILMIVPWYGFAMCRHLRSRLIVSRLIVKGLMMHYALERYGLKEQMNKKLEKKQN